MSRFAYFVAICLALLAVVSAQVTFSGRTRKGPTIPNAGGVALSGDSTTAFVHTISTTASSVYAVGPLPVTTATVATVFFTTSISQQIYYIAASASISPQMVWILDNQNAQLKSLQYTPGVVLNTSTIVYDFGIANLDLISGMYYQASTNLIFLSFYDHFNGAVNDYIGYLNPSATNPTVSVLYTTNLVAALAGIAVNGAYLYYASVSSAMGAGSQAAIYRVRLTQGGARPATAASTSVAIYNTTQPDLTQATSINGYVIYPAAMQFSADGATLYFTDIGDQSVQPASTPHAVYALNDVFYYTPSNPLNLTTVVAYIGVQTEVQQSFALSGGDAFLYFAGTGTQNGMYYNTAPNSSFAGSQPGPPLAQSAAPTAGGAAAVSSSAAAAVSSSAARVSSSATPVSSSAAAVSSSAAAVSSSAARVSSSAAPVSSSAAAVSSSAAPVSSSATPVSSSAAAVSSSAAAVSSSAAAQISSSVAPAVASSSAAAARSSSAAGSSSAAALSSSAVPAVGASSSAAGGVSAGGAPIPAGTVTNGPSATFSDANDALSCLSSNGNATVGFAASNGGNIFVFNLQSVPAALTYTLSTGPGSSGPSFVACQANAAGSFLYLLDTRQSLFTRYNVATNTVQTVATFSDEAAGALTSLVIDFVANFAYIGTRSSTNLYQVPIGTLGQSFNQGLGNPLTSDILSLALSADRLTIYYGFPAPSQGAPGGIASLNIANLINQGQNNPTVVLQSASIIYPDALYLNDSSTIYFKDGGAFQAKSGPSQSTLQTISSVNLVGTRVLTTIYSTLTQNLPNGLIPVPATPFFQLAYTTSTNVNFITVVNTTGTGAVTAAASSAGVAAVSSSAAAAVSSSAARVSSSATPSSSAAGVSSSAAAVSSSAAAASSSAAAVPSSSAAVATPSSSAAVAAASSSASARSSSAAAVSSSAAAASSSAVLAASSVAAVSSSSGTRVVGDPMFVGFLRQRFQVHGMDNVVYNILSQASVSINALFVFLESGACPIVDGEPLTNCWSHPGSYFGSLSLQTASGDKLEIVSGAATSGFQAIRFDGEEVKAVKGVEGAGAKLSFKVLSSHSMAITIDNYRLVVENSDMFVNLVSIEVLDWQQLASVDQPHGLLGQTWKPSRKARAGQVVAVKDVAEGDVDDYVITSDQLFGTDFVYNKFAAKSQ